jgi:hypothetical protein
LVLTRHPSSTLATTSVAISMTDAASAALVHPRSSTGPCSPYPGTVLIEPKQVDRPFSSHTFFTLRRPVAKRSDSFLAKQNGIKR